MKSFLILAAVLVALVPCVSAQPVRTRQKAFAVPSGVGEGGSDTMAQWSLPVASFRDGTTTAVNPADGKILVRGICATSSAAGGKVALYDTDRIDGLTIANAVGNLLAQFQAKMIDGASADTAKSSCEWFPRGIPTVSGLAWLTSATTVRATVYYDKIAD